VTGSIPALSIIISITYVDFWWCGGGAFFGIARIAILYTFKRVKVPSWAAGFGGLDYLF
jgi:hypothetical protein